MGYKCFRWILRLLKIISLVVEHVRDFKNKLMIEPPPKTINILVNSIIPLKDIKRGKSSEGGELSNGEELNECKEENDEECDDGTELLQQSLGGDLPIERVRQEQNKESNNVLGNYVSLVIICDDENINKDAKFEIKKHLILVKLYFSLNLSEISLEQHRKIQDAILRIPDKTSYSI